MLSKAVFTLAIMQCINDNVACKSNLKIEKNSFKNCVAEKFVT